MESQLEWPTLTPEELGIVRELLEREVRNLMIEVRHADVRAARDSLHQRLDEVEAILKKLQVAREV